MIYSTRASFSGDRSISAPASWSQLGMWRTILKSQPYDGFMNMRFALPIPNGLTYEGIVRILVEVVSCHEALRTIHPTTTDGELTQVVASRGDLQLEIIENTVDETARELLDGFASTPFKYATEWPVRFAVLVREGQIDGLFVVLSPLAIDWYAENLLKRELASRLRGYHSTKAEGLPLRPVDRALEERSQAGRSRNRLAVQRWSRFVDEFDVTNFPSRRGDDRAPRWTNAILRSSEMVVAVGQLADRCQVSVPAVYHAASAVMISALSGKDIAVMHNMGANRFSTAEMACMGRLTQASAAAVRVANSPFEEVIRRASVAGIRSYAMAHYSTADVDAIVDADLFDCFHNNLFEDGVRRPTLTARSPECGPAGATSKIVDTQTAPFSTHQFAVEVAHQGKQAEMSLLADHRYLPISDPSRLLIAMDALILRAAVDPNGTPAVVLAHETLGAQSGRLEAGRQHIG
ncbi:condensation domain-containing protein [Nocardia vinacea]|uniref:condensation domain-containing protein n=1 Tax=Nocardia vinacea TaxID=96468 RepID=UPI0033EA1997